MPTFHMEVEATMALVQHIRQTCRSFENQYSQLSGEVNSSIGSSWISPTATEFQKSFQECSTDVRKVTEQLETLAMRLQNEISEWEQTASKLA